MSRIARGLLFVIISSLVAFGQSPSTGRAPSDDPLAAKVDRVFSAWDKPDSPGCALGVMKDGQLVYARGYGMANLEHAIPISSKTVFDIGSTSKQFTAASIVLLAEQGKLSLDDTVRKFVPELPDYGKPITIRHLLHHTSGIRDYLTLMSLAGTDFDGVTTDDDALRLIVRQKALNFAPGDEHLYSNSGYFLLSVIVKRASGKSLRQFAEENIFAPLGMKHTHFHDDHTIIVRNRATAYAPQPSGGFRIAMSGFEQTGDRAVMTTIEDLLLWDQNFYQPKVGSKEMINRMLVPGTLNSGEKLTYALGLMVDDYKGLRLVSHGGSWAGYRAELIRFPEQKFSVVCLCNLATTNPSQLARQVADLYLADLLVAKVITPTTTANPEPVALSEAEMKARVGLFRSTTTGTLRRIVHMNNKLRLDQFGPSAELMPLAKDRFRVVGPSSQIEIVFDDSQRSGPLRFTLSREGSKPETFEAVQAVSPKPDGLAEYVGAYFSEELDVTYNVVLDGDKLAIRGKGIPARTIQPTYRDSFIGSGGAQFQFSRDARARVSGFAVQAGRIRNVLFVKQSR
jgi:CubicO group peptidase (beta-lactamase class C family)